MRIIVRGARGNEHLCQKGDALVERLKLLARFYLVDTLTIAVAVMTEVYFQIKQWQCKLYDGTASYEQPVLTPWWMSTFTVKETGGKHTLHMCSVDC